MEGNGFSGRLFSNMGGGMLGLEMPLQTQTQTQTQTQAQPQPPSQNTQHLQQNPQLMAFSHPQHQQFDQQTQLSMRQPNNLFANPNPPPKPKTQMPQSGNSDEDEPGCPNEEGSFDGKRKNIAPWQRMKWTDNMVRLLIMAVYYIGDEAASELGSEKKKPSGGGGSGGQLQKKGKWKSVSRAMMEKGFCVSPQQCEDKFNDLNKRYKRVNDILGKGTACKVVENHSLLDTMDHISPKVKEEARKLLNSKHLFFREMCAYHNSCGHGLAGHGADTNTANQSAMADGASHDHKQLPHQPQQQLCLHSSTSAPSPPASMVHSNSKLDDHDMDDDSESDSEFNDSDDDPDHEDAARAGKRSKTTGDISSNTLQAQLSGEIMGVLQDGSKSPWEKKQWVMTRLVQFEEQGVKFQCEALELEKQRIKWMKFSSKKEREMERMKMENEKKKLENERMVLMLRRKEIEMLMQEQRPSNPSCIAG